MGINVVGHATIPAADPDSRREYLHHGATETRGASDVHGLGRRPSKADLTPLDLDAIAAWTAANRRAREHYYAAPNALIVARMAN